MFEVSSEVFFSAAHHLKNYNGPCENIHGHNWLVKVYIRTEKLNSLGLCIDFKILRSLMNEVTDELDHNDLNKIFDKLNQNPSSENIARYIFDKMKIKIKDFDCSLSRVDIYETPGNCASYFEND